jgi:hypothetical protein
MIKNLQLNFLIYNIIFFIFVYIFQKMKINLMSKKYIKTFYMLCN